MRKMSELLQILLDNTRYINGENIGGLCALCLMLRIWREISFVEYKELKTYIANHRPANIKNGFYWRIGAKAPRKKWLKEQIELNKM